MVIRHYFLPCAAHRGISTLRGPSPHPRWGGDYNNEMVARQHRLLQFENRASRDARFEFRNIYFCIDEHVEKHVHNLSLADPFSDSHR